MRPSSIDVWLSRGKQIEIGGRELTLVPLPISRLRDIQAAIEEKIYQQAHEMVEDQAKNPDAMQFISDMLKSFDFVDLVYHVFADPKRPDNREPVNPNLDKEFFKEYLDTPTLRKIVIAFIEVNELEEVVKGFLQLPGVRKLMEALMTTFGIAFLNSLGQSSGSSLGMLRTLPTLSSPDSSKPGTDDENPQATKETVQ